jgi:hypothetical protein
MKSLKLVFLFFTLQVLAQSKVEENILITDLKNQILERQKVSLQYEFFNSEQNTLFNKKYKEKIKAEISLLKSELIILEGPLYDLINSVFLKIIKANPSLSSGTRLVLYRSNDFNAFTMGDNVIFVHIGLLHEIQNEAQLALVLAHEIAHNSLGHIEQALIKSVFLETDKELKDNIKSISKSDYGHVSELNKLLVPRLLENKQESRKNEFQADSLGLLYVKNAGYNVKQAFSIFHVMEKESKSLSYPISFDRIWHFDRFPELKEKSDSYTRESSLGSMKKDTSLASYLSSHPYDQSRFMRLAVLEQVDTVFNNYKLETYDEFLVGSKSLIIEEKLETAFLKRNFSDVVYTSMRLLELNPKDSIALKSFVLCLYSLNFLKEKRLAGKYLRRQSPNQPEDFDRVCSFLYELTPKECKELALFYKQHHLNQTIYGIENIIFTLFEYTINEDYDALVPFWQLNYKEMKNSPYICLVGDVETYLTNTKSIRLIKK